VHAVRQAPRAGLSVVRARPAIRPGEENLPKLLRSVTRLQAVVRAKLVLMLYASGRLWFADAVDACAQRTSHKHHTSHAKGVSACGVGGAVHHLLIQLLLEDGGLVRKQRVDDPHLGSRVDSQDSRFRSLEYHEFEVL
jgi:hypothetical protein